MSSSIFNPGSGGAGTVTNTGTLTANKVITGNGTVDVSASNVTLTNPATTATITVADNKVVTVSNTLTLAGTDGTTMTFPATSATVARTDAANTFTGHQTIEGVTSTGATGTGKIVFDTTPTLATPVLGVATATSINKVAFTAPTTAATFAFGTDNTTQTFQGTGTIVSKTSTDTLTNKTLNFATSTGNVSQINGQAQVASITGSAYTNATTSFTDVTGLSFAIEANRTYFMVFSLVRQSSATTAGPKYQFTGPSSPTTVEFNAIMATISTTIKTQSANAFGSPVINAGVVTTAADEVDILYLLVANGPNAGTVQLQSASNGTGTVTLQVGSAGSITA